MHGFVLMRGFWLLALGLVACGALREGALGDDDVIDDRPDATTGDDDDVVDERPDATADGGRDAPPVREDFVCAGASSWANPERAAECLSHGIQQVQALPDDANFPLGQIDLAWSASGRAAIVVAYSDSFEGGFMQALQFDTGPATVTVRPDRVARDPEVDTEQEGAGARVVARSDGAFDVLSLKTFQGEGGDVSIRRLTPDQGFLAPDLVFAGADQSAQLAMVMAPTGVLTATAVVSSDADLKIVTRRRTAGATAFEDVAVNDALGFFANGPSTNGNHKLAIDSLGAIHIAYESGLFYSRSQPRYARLIGNGWSTERTIDNAVPDVLAGASLSLYVKDGDEKNAVYLRQAKEGKTPLDYGQLVRAHWVSANEDIQVQVLVDHLPLHVADERSYVLATAAAGVDASGAMHVVYADQRDAVDAGQPRCQVHYLREASKNGAIGLLEDDVSDLVPCTNFVPAVALAVEPGGRPHIGYVIDGAGAASGVWYATRHDR